MKHLLIALIMGTSLGLSAQGWSPKATSTAAVKTTVQCWGETTKHAQCKKRINPEAPAKAVKGADGHWYCAAHTKQAK